MNVCFRWLAAGALLTLFVPPAYCDDAPSPLQSLIARQAPAIVTVRAVLKTEFKGAGASQSTESRTEMEGAVVDPSGLIMISSLPFSTDKMIELMGIPKEAAANAPKITPTDFKVVFEREEKEYPAFLAATDTTLGLTFLQIKDLGGRTLTAISFAGSPSPNIGDSVFAVARLSRGYDYAPYVESARVSGLLSKPRAALMLDGSVSDLGLPVFSATGEAIGVLTNVASGVASSDSSDAMGMNMMMRLFGGAGGGSHPGVFVVPNSAISAVVAQAKTRADTLSKTQAAEPVKPDPASPTK